MPEAMSQEMWEAKSEKNNVQKIVSARGALDTLGNAMRNIIIFELRKLYPFIHVLTRALEIGGVVVAKSLHAWPRVALAALLYRKAFALQTKPDYRRTSGSCCRNYCNYSVLERCHLC